MEIPKIIHQIWLGSRKPPLHVMNTWRVHHPEWKYLLWREQDLQSLYIYSRMKLVNSFTMRSDLARYELLWRYGGLYADCDMLSTQPIDTFLNSLQLLLVEDSYWFSRKGFPANNIMACMQKHNFFKAILYSLLNKKLPKTAHGLFLTGPGYIYNFLPKDYSLFPTKLFESEPRDLPDKSAVYSLHTNVYHSENISLIKEYL